MNSTRKRWRNALCSKPRIAGLLLGVFLLVLAMAHSWALHHSVCTDASAPAHKCAVTLLTGGQVHVAANAVAVATAPNVVVARALPEPLLLTVADFSLLPGRGPPASLT
jgi:hypothetical protein